MKATPINRTEGAKLIAAFMGIKNVFSSSYRGTEFVYKGEDEEGSIDYTEGINILSYDCDWSQLMPVVNKIASMGHDISFSIESGCYWACAFDKVEQDYEPIGEIQDSPKSMIEAIYNMVIGFVQWYNSKNI